MINLILYQLILNQQRFKQSDFKSNLWSTFSFSSINTSISNNHNHASRISSNHNYQSSLMNKSFNRDEIARDVGNYDTADFIISIANKYQQLINQNIQIDENDISSTSKIFCCGNIEKNISIYHYISRIIQFLNEFYDHHNIDQIGMKSTGLMILIFSTIYLDRFLVANQNSFKLHSSNIYHLLFVATIIAIINSNNFTYLQ